MYTIVSVEKVHPAVPGTVGYVYVLCTIFSPYDSDDFQLTATEISREKSQGWDFFPLIFLSLEKKTLWLFASFCTLENF